MAARNQSPWPAAGGPQPHPTAPPYPQHPLYTYHQAMASQNQQHMQTPPAPSCGPSSPLSGSTHDPTDYALLSTLPPCPGSTFVYNYPWHGFSNLVICPRCWASFACHTPLAAGVTLRGVPIAEGRMCCLYSPRMRAMWLETGAVAASSSSEEAKLAAIQQLLSFALMRLNVWSATVPQIRSLRHGMMMQSTSAMFAGLMSTMYHGMDVSRNAMGLGSDGYRYGSDALGWYRSEHGAEGAQWAVEQRAVMARSCDGGTMAAIAELEARWASVE